MTKWLTLKQVQAAAKRGRKPALLCSIKHWRQLHGAGKHELLLALLREDVDVGADWCALCSKYRLHKTYCHGCPLRAHFGSRCWDYAPGHPWRTVARVVDEVEVSDGAPAPWRRWKRASLKMLRALETIYRDLYGEEPDRGAVTEGGSA